MGNTPAPNRAGWSGVPAGRKPDRRRTEPTRLTACAANAVKNSCKNKLGFWGEITLTPALSHRMGEGESSSVGRRIQPLWKLRATGLSVPSPVGRERVRVRDILFEIRL